MCVLLNIDLIMPKPSGLHMELRLCINLSFMRFSSREPNLSGFYDFIHNYYGSSTWQQLCGGKLNLLGAFASLWNEAPRMLWDAVLVLGITLREPQRKTWNFATRLCCTVKGRVDVFIRRWIWTGGGPLLIPSSLALRLLRAAREIKGKRHV